jgi:hypothetical protein
MVAVLKKYKLLHTEKYKFAAPKKNINSLLPENYKLLYPIKFAWNNPGPFSLLCLKLFAQVTQR